MEENVFNKLNSINVNDKTEKKNGLTYLSWAWAWGEVKRLYPKANYTIYENTLPDGYVVNYFTDGRTAWVKTGVTIEDLEHIEELPVMDYRNKSILLENMTSFDVNKTIQRSLTKALARHGLGLYIYAGEDLPEEQPKIVEEGVKTLELEDKISDELHKGLLASINKQKIDDEKVLEIISKYGYSSTSEVKMKDYKNIINDFLNLIGKK